MAFTKISKRDALVGADRTISVQHSMVHKGLFWHRSVVIGPVGNGSTYWIGWNQTDNGKRVHVKSARFWMVGHYWALDLYEGVTWSGGSTYPGFCRHRNLATAATMIPTIGITPSGGSVIMQLNRGGASSTAAVEADTTVAAWNSEWILDHTEAKYAWKIVNATGASNRLAFEFEWYELPS